MATTSKQSVPRISANDLALYMVSSDTAKLGIVRRAKHPQTSPIIRYRDARSAICAYLSDPIRSVNPLITAEQALLQRKSDMSVSALMRDDAEHSIDVVRAIQSMNNKLRGYDFHKSPAKQQKLKIQGVEVSVHADLIVYGAHKGEDEIGAAVLRMTVDDADTDSAKSKRKDMGLYVATLARLHILQNLPTNRSPANRLCMSIDVQHGEVFICPDANAQRTKNIESACQMISALWATL